MMFPQYLGTMRVKLHRKKRPNFLGSSTVKVSYVKTRIFMDVFSPFQHDCFHDSPLLDNQSLRLIEWMGCPLNIEKGRIILVRMLFMKIYFPTENVFIFQLFLHITLLLYKHSVFSVRVSMLMIFLIPGLLCL